MNFAELDAMRPAEPEPIVHDLPEPEPIAESGPDPQEIAQRIIAQATSQAQALILEAEMKRTEIEERAKKAGWDEGFQAGEKAWMERFERIESEAERLQQEREAFFLSAETELAAFSLDIARKILHQELQIRPEAVLEVTRAALSRVKGREVRMRVHPDDYALVHRAKTDLASVSYEIGAIEVIGDLKVERGGCRIETDSATVDAQPETQLGRIAESIASVGERSADDPDD
jgi:flagellar assembly protein FliH